VASNQKWQLGDSALTEPTQNPNPEPAAGLHPETSLPQDLQSGYHPNTDEVLKQGHAATAHKLAGWLLVILGGTVLIHYTCMMVLIYFNLNEGVKIMEDLFHSLLPVLAGLAGSAATYYFTKNGK